jgi:hypothetical protein
MSGSYNNTRPTKRSKKLNKVIFQVNLVARLTKTRRHHYPQNDATNQDTFYGRPDHLRVIAF